MIDVLVPVLDRPQLIEPLITSLELSQKTVELHPLLLLTPGRDQDLKAVKASGAPYVVCNFELDRGDFARKINYGIVRSTHEWVLAAATDLCFHLGWAEQALRVAEETTKRFIGTQDLGNPGVLKGIHATHPLVHRSYIERHGTCDEPGKLYHEGYWHEWVDHEAVETAKWRGEWAFASEAIVEHIHPYFNKAERDWVYDRGHEQSREDHRLFARRRKLWRSKRSRS